MPSVNKIILIGTGIDAPQVRETDGGNVVSRFSLSVERPGKPNTPARVDEIPIVAWGELASASQNLVQKGHVVVVEGRISVRSFEQDGQRKWVTEVEARQLRPFGSSQSHAQEQPQAQAQAQVQTQPSAPSYQLETKPGSDLATSEFSFNSLGSDDAAAIPFGNGANEEVPF